MDTQLTDLVCLNTKDNVGLAIQGLLSGASIKDGDLICQEDIPAGHKMALTFIGKGDPVIKYGSVIGFARNDIPKGTHVHTHNVYVSEVSTKKYEVGTKVSRTRFRDPASRPTFDGYLRPSGQVGTRNYIGILSTVNCSASVAHFIADKANKIYAGKYEGFDGFVAISHGAGCCMTIGGEGLAYLQMALAGFAMNPNFGGILVVGLGCEVNLVNTFLEAGNLNESPLLKTLDIQNLGGTRNTVSKGLELIDAMILDVVSIRRQPISVEHLVVGLECGGSDAYSGITSNPSLGAAADLVVENGGTVILAETPEIYGAEHLLIERASSPEVAKKLMDRISWWEAYTKKHDAQLNNNPTPGNKAGGISTILEKSLGAVAKAGTTNLNEVYTYAEPVNSKGLVFMDTPGYDIVSVTGMIAGGANMVCFTTGRGTVVGFKPVPCLKLASNTPLFDSLSDDIDINCGLVLDQGVHISHMGEKIFKTILKVASGKLSKSEAQGFGDREFVPWHIGAVL
ncbi:MAG: altronate dehydratase family protein [Desulfobacterium sp.]